MSFLPATLPATSVCICNQLQSLWFVDLVTRALSVPNQNVNCLGARTSISLAPVVCPLPRIVPGTQQVVNKNPSE